MPEKNGAELFVKGMVYIYLNNTEKGIDYLIKSEQEVPGAGWTFTLKNMTIFKRCYGEFLNIKKSNNETKSIDFNGVISMSNLGIEGRLGDQCFYYIGLKVYAYRNNYLVETPDWIGRYIFKESSHDPYILGRYETIESTDSSFLDSLLGKGLPPKKAFNLKGGCYPSSITQDEKKYIQRIFRPLPYWKEQTNKIIDKLKHSDNKNRTLVALHIRRGNSKNSGRYVHSSTVY